VIFKNQFYFTLIYFTRLRSIGGLGQNGRNTVQGTFDDLSEPEKTRAYLQFLQYHQQLEQENETNRFQEMLNNDDDQPPASDQGENGSEATTDDKVDDESQHIWNGLSSSWRTRTSISFVLIMYLVTVFL
jgi:hypothetical protein